MEIGCLRIENGQAYQVRDDREEGREVILGKRGKISRLLLEMTKGGPGEQWLLMFEDCGG